MDPVDKRKLYGKQEAGSARAPSTNSSGQFFNFLVKQREQLDEQKNRRSSIGGKIIPSCAIRDDRHGRRHPSTVQSAKSQDPDGKASERKQAPTPSKDRRNDWHQQRELQLKLIKEHQWTKPSPQKETKKKSEKPRNDKERQRKMLDELLKEKGKFKEIVREKPKLEPEDEPLDQYAIGKVIGQGAYAVVREAVHKTKHIKFAIKTYDKLRLIDIQRKKGVQREIAIMQKLSHPNIVKLHEVIDTPKHLHLVMEYLSGSSLHSYLKRRTNRRLSSDEARSIFAQLLSAISYCHSQSIVHRDIKLENIIIDQSLSVKLIDFGFSTNFPHEIKVKVFCGTPSYMAPEIVARKEYAGPPVDVWALGVLLFVLLCGTFPFKASSDKELYYKIRKGRFHMPEHLSPGARQIITRCLAYEPRARPPVDDLILDKWMVTAENSQCTTLEKPEGNIKALSIEALDCFNSTKKFNVNQSKLPDENSQILKFGRRFKADESLMQHYSATINY